MRSLEDQRRRQLAQGIGFDRSRRGLAMLRKFRAEMAGRGDRKRGCADRRPTCVSLSALRRRQRPGRPEMLRTSVSCPDDAIHGPPARLARPVV